MYQVDYGHVKLEKVKYLVLLNISKKKMCHRGTETQRVWRSEDGYQDDKTGRTRSPRRIHCTCGANSMPPHPWRGLKLLSSFRAAGKVWQKLYSDKNL